MDECSTCSIVSKSDPHWCDIWRPPPLPIDQLPQIYKTKFSELLQNETLKLKEHLNRYANICHLSLPDIITGKSSTPTVVTTSLSPHPVQEVATAGFAGWLVLALVLLILVALIIVIYYWKKKHGRYIMINQQCRCCSLSGMNWKQLSGKFSSFTSKRSENIESEKEMSDTSMSINREENRSFTLTENHCSPPSKQNGGFIYNPVNNFNINAENTITVESAASDFIVCSNVAPGDTKESTMMTIRYSAEHDNGSRDWNEYETEVDVIETMDVIETKDKTSDEQMKDLAKDVTDNKENMSKEQITDSTPEPVRYSAEHENGSRDWNEYQTEVDVIQTMDIIETKDKTSDEQMKDLAKDATENKENISKEQITDSTPETVKRRKKKKMFRRINKIHSYPVDKSDQDMKIGEAVERKSY